MKCSFKVMLPMCCALMLSKPVWGSLNDPRIGERTRVLKDVTTPHQETRRIFVIGDSLSDSDRRMQTQSHGLVPPKDIYWQGHLTNGPTWNQYLAAALDVPVYSYALAGARIKEVNNYYVIPPNLKLLWADPINMQINKMDQDKIRFTDKDLIAIWIGGNDYLLYPDEKKIKSLVNHMQDQLIRLRKRGASRFVLLNIPDITQTPFHTLHIADIIMPAKKLRPLVIEHNRMLQVMVEDFRKSNPQIKISLVDTFSAIDELYQKRELFDVDEVKKPCIAGEFLPKNVGAGFLYAKDLPQVQCRNPEQHFYWDPWHPTTKVHCLTAVKVLEVLMNDQVVNPFDFYDTAQRCLMTHVP